MAIPSSLVGIPTPGSGDKKAPIVTRHKVWAQFLSWNHPQPIVAGDNDLIAMDVQKRLGTTGAFSLTLLDRGFEKVLRPDDWVWIFVHPRDGIEQPECLIIGMIDSIRRGRDVDEQGTRRSLVHVTGSGWEKALEKTQMFSDPTLNQLGMPANIWTTIVQEVTNRTKRLPNQTQLIRTLVPALVRAWLTTASFQAQPLGPSAPPVDAEVLEKIIDDIELQAITPGDWRIPGVPFSSDAAIIDPSAPPADVPLGTPSAITVGVKVPQLNVPLYNLMKILVEQIEDLVSVTPAAWIGLIGGSALKTISSISNQPINEVIYDVRNVDNPLDGRRDTAEISGELRREFPGLAQELPGPAAPAEELLQAIESVAEAWAVPIMDNHPGGIYGFVPHMILRRRPLFREEFQKLPVTEMFEEDDIIHEDLGYSDAQIANVVFLNPAPFGGAGDPAVKFFGRLNEYIHQESFSRHGLRYFAETVTALPSEQSWVTKDYATLQVWVDRIHKSMVQNADLQSGTISTRRFRRNAVIGSALIRWASPQNKRHTDPVQQGITNLGVNLGFTRDQIGARTASIFYIEGVVMSWSYPGVFTHSFEVTRGQPIR